nr:hypothetical protein [uncultured Ruminococcus sp.]
MISNNAPRIPRMRTVSEAIQELKALDPHTAMTPYHIRRICLDGVLPTIKAGKKLLLNFDDLVEYMENPNSDKFKPRTESNSEKSGVIRRIEE